MSECVVRMEMPEGCICCPMGSTSDAYGYHWCGVLERDMEECLGRPTECPILAVLPEKHGRLVDVDALPKFDTSGEYTAFHFIGAIENAPTIVPATEGGEERND